MKSKLGSLLMNSKFNLKIKVMLTRLLTIVSMILTIIYTSLLIVEIWPSIKPTLKFSGCPLGLASGAAVKENRKAIGAENRRAHLPMAFKHRLS